MPTLIPLDSPLATDPARCGQKAARLAALSALGFPVPLGFVVPADACRAVREAASLPPDLRDELRRAFARLGGTFAVRSSGCAEDLDDASFAGLYETVLGVRDAEGLEAALATCIASASAPRVRAYFGGERAQEAALAVLIQRMVPARASGVAFSAHPVTGDRGTATVSAVLGLGDRLVGGETDAEEWEVTDSPERMRGRTAVLRPSEAAQLAALARKVGGEGPIDIEWAIEGEGDAAVLHLLQARPMTALPEPVRWESPVPGFFVRNLRIGEWLGTPVTPLFASWCIPAMEARTADYSSGLTGIILNEPHHIVVNGWYYMGLNAQLGPWAICKALATVLWNLRRRWDDYLILSPGSGHKVFPGVLKRWREQSLPRWRTLVDEAERASGRANPAELVALVDRLVDEVATQFNEVTLLAGFAGKAEWSLQEFLSKHLPERDVGVVDLVVGAHHALAAHDVEGLDWFLPTFGERGLSAPPADPQRAEAALLRRDEAVARLAARLPARLQAELRSRVSRACDAHVARVEQTGLLTLGWPVLRRILGLLGDHLVSSGRLALREDVHFLRRDELLALLLDGPPLPGLVERRASWERQRRLCPPLQLGRMEGIASKGYGALLQAFRRPEQNEPGVIAGMAASGGQVTAIARVVRAAEELDRLAPGEVLVTPVTTPLWTIAFSRAAAVVTDSGSLASHASVVAREYGIPAVVGTGTATVRIRDGQLVTVDGTRGLVRLDG